MRERRRFAFRIFATSRSDGVWSTAEKEEEEEEAEGPLPDLVEKNLHQRLRATFAQLHGGKNFEVPHFTSFVETVFADNFCYPNQSTMLLAQYTFTHDQMTKPTSVDIMM